MADHGGILIRRHVPDIFRSHTKTKRIHGYDSQDGTGTDEPPVPEKAPELRD